MAASAETVKNNATVERRSDREVVMTRTINGPPRLVFEAFSKPELLKRWWVPKSAPIKLLSLEADVRAGGSYRFTFDVGEGKTMAFFGKYTEVTPHSRIVWTNEEGEGGVQITTLTLEERGGKTLLTMHELHPSKEALDACLGSGAYSGMCEAFDQLEELFGTA